MTDTRLFTLLFTGTWCLVGAIFLCVGIGLRRSFARREERLRARAEGVVAEIVRRERRDSDGRGVSWYPIVEFEADVRKISLECGDGGGRKTFYEGQRVEVLYDPDDPSVFRIEGHGTTRLLGNIFLAVGLVCVAIGVIAGWAIHTFSAGIHID